MTTARALLRRLLSHGRLDPHVPTQGSDQASLEQPVVEQRLDAARDRLRQTIPPPEGADAPRPGQDAETPSPGQDAETPSPGQDAATPPPGQDRAIPPPKGVSPEEDSPSVP